MSEVWKDVVGYEGLYKVSSLGRVMGFAWKQEWNIMKQDINSQGYYWIKLCKDREPKGYSVARLVGLAFIPNPDNLPEIDHIDRNKLDNTLSNLRWVSKSENCINRTERGNISGNKHIYYRQSKNRYEVAFQRRPDKIFKTFKTLPEAIEYRDKWLSEN